MRRKRNLFLETLIFVAFLLGSCGMALAQGSQGSQGGQGSQGSQSQPPAQSTDKSKTPDVTPLSLDSAPPPVNAEEDAAFKAYQESPPNDWNKKIELGEAFLQKYPQSRYLPPIYSGLTIGYMQTNQIQKMLDIGDKAVTLTPNDLTTLSILSQTISRVTNSTTPNAAKQL